MNDRRGDALEFRRAVAFGFALVCAVGALLPSARAQAPATTKNAVDEPEARPGVGDIAAMERLLGLEFTDDEREQALPGVLQNRASYEALRALDLPNSVPPALDFDPVPVGMTFDREQRPIRFADAGDVKRPATDEELAFLSVSELSALLRAKRVTSVELTRLYLDRLKEYGPDLQCVVTLTEELALEQARRADAEIAAGKWRGPLHGIPYGVKDLFAVEGYPTTWGAEPFKDQMLDETATVVKRLEAAGAVLVAKLTLGALAWGDVWYGGVTKSPWDLSVGSSGSSAGSASATAAGLVGFSLGTETLGSIVSPCTRCGVTGLRPTYGRVSRTGAMALSWTMDKVGPICRTVEDCALVFDAIRGPDGIDRTLTELPFNYDAELPLEKVRIGYVASAFGDRRGRLDNASLEVLRELGVELVEVELPTLPIGAMRYILNAEAAAAFDDLTRSGRDAEMVRQVTQAWPNVFRQSRFVPAVEYIQANRVRTLLIDEMARVFDDVDVYVAPSFSESLLLTNLTGHPAVVLPNGFRREAPASITLIGSLYGEAELLTVARRLQEATDFHRRHPDLAANVAKAREAAAAPEKGDDGEGGGE